MYVCVYKYIIVVYGYSDDNDSHWFLVWTEPPVINSQCTWCNDVNWCKINVVDAFFAVSWTKPVIPNSLFRQDSLNSNHQPIGQDIAHLMLLGVISWFWLATKCLDPNIPHLMQEINCYPVGMSVLWHSGTHTHPSCDPRAGSEICWSLLYGVGAAVRETAGPLQHGLVSGFSLCWDRGTRSESYRKSVFPKSPERHPGVSRG